MESASAESYASFDQSNLNNVVPLGGEGLNSFCIAYVSTKAEKMIASFIRAGTALLALAGPISGSAIDRQLVVHTLGITAKPPSECPGYVASNVKVSGNSITASLKLAGPACNAYGNDIPSLQLLVEYQTTERLHIKIYDSAEMAYQVPQSVLPDPPNAQPGFRVNQQDLQFNYVAKPFSFSVTRQSTGEVVFDTSGWPVIFEDHYLGLRTKLPDNPSIYGLGENTDPMMLTTTNFVRTVWNRDAGATPQMSNLYGDHPVYYDHRGANGTHAVFLKSNAGADFKLNNTGPGTQYLEYNLISGIFDFYFLSGPTPKKASMQYALTVGKPVMMPYWGLGFHQCRYGMQDVWEVAGVVANYSTNDIPLETMWTDIDYMNLRRVFTLDPVRFPLRKMQQLVDYLHSHLQHYVIMVDPAVAYYPYAAFNNGVAAGAFLLNSSGLPYQGVVWPGVTAFPDFFADGTQGYWNQEFYSFFHPDTGLDIDALWIDMNEASNFCDYPCTNPESYAITAGNPPVPPPARLYSPYKIPGFPKDFQPHCMSYVVFSVKASTSSGGTILVTGNQATLGTNIANQSPVLSSNDSSTWRGTVEFPVNTEVKYRYVRAELNGNDMFEAEVRTVKTGGCNSHVFTNDVMSNTTTSKSKGASYPRVQAVPAPVPNNSVGAEKGYAGRNLDSPPYAIANTNGPLSSKTINVTVIHQNGLVEYDTHNLYGTMMSASSRIAMENRRPGVRPMIITRSTFAGAGRQVGHWLGDNISDWWHYRAAIRQVIEFTSMFQMPMVGADVCGFLGAPDKFLCARWAMLGAYGEPPQEFYRWPLVAAAAKKAISARYQLLDYIYTAMYTQTTTGAPTANPMFFIYPNDTNTFGLENQYFYGDAIMVAPVVEDNATYVDFYMPNDIFYDFWTHAPVQGNGSNYTIPYVDFTSLPLYYKGGHIIPQRLNSANTTEMLRQEPFNIVIAPGSDGTATGLLYIDEGTKIDQPEITLVNMYYDRKSGKFSMNGTMDYSGVKIGQITVLGANGAAASSIKLAVAFGIGGPKYDRKAQSLTYKVDVALTKDYSLQLH